MIVHGDGRCYFHAGYRDFLQEGAMGLGWLLLIVGAVLLWLTGLAGVLTNAAGYRYGSKPAWTLAVLLTGPPGAAIYLALGSVRRPATTEPRLDRRSMAAAIANPWSEAPGA
jgi:hypothetical protein